MTIQEILAAEEKAQSEYEKTATYNGYIVADLRAIFEQITSSDDWRGPIGVITTGEHVNAIVAAIQYFTATTPTIGIHMGEYGMTYAIESMGYREGPAGDH